LLSHKNKRIHKSQFCAIFYLACFERLKNAIATEIFSEERQIAWGFFWCFWLFYKSVDGKRSVCGFAIGVYNTKLMDIFFVLLFVLLKRSNLFLLWRLTIAEAQDI
jgi:hypothetical protein